MSVILAQRAVDEVRSRLTALAEQMETRELSDAENKEVDEKRAELDGLQQKLDREKYLDTLKAQSEKTVTLDKADRSFAQRCADYSTAKVMAKLSTGANTDTGNEREISAEIRNKYPDYTVGEYVIPWEALQTRTINVGGVGADLTTEDYKAGMLIELLRPKLGNLGVTMLSGLSSDVRIPKKMSQNKAAAWLAETGNAAESTPTFSAISLSPHKVGAVESYSLQASLQAQPNVETIVRQDLQDALADFLAEQFLYATGASNAPQGISPQITATTRAGTTTNGKALDLDDLIALQVALATNNVDGGMFLCNYQTKFELMKTKKFGTDSETDEALWSGGGILGMPTQVSNFVKSDNTKGSSTTLSDLFYARWSDAIIASWGGGLSLMNNPYSGFNKGEVAIRIMGFFDYAIRHGESFVKFSDVDA